MNNLQKQKEKVIAFDFDGVIATYFGFKGKEHEEKPIDETVKAIKLLKEKGFKILIHSTRSDGFLKNYCEKYSIPFDYINKNPLEEGDNTRKPPAYLYIDDRAICFEGQNAEKLVEQVDNFKVYWKK